MGMITPRLGHATITETMDTYASSPMRKDFDRGAIDAIFAVTPAEQGRNQATS
jgi:hypothetical protein